MDAQQIENAIEIAWNPTADQALKEQAFDFLNQLRVESRGWQVCTTLFTQTPRKSEVVRLVSLEVVNNAVHTNNLDQAGLAFLKEALLEYVRRVYGGEGQEPPDQTSLQNKLAQTLTFLFVILYKNGWESFIDDFLALTGLPNSHQRDNLPGVVLYLRILGSIHDEIADLLLNRQDTESKRNTNLKDLLRERDMRKIATSWLELLAVYGNRDDVVTEMVLKVIGKWVSWIDISLVISEEMLNQLFPLVGRTNSSGGEDKVRDAAINNFTEIVAKKMKPADKVELISFLNLREVIGQLIASPPLQDLKGTPKYDTDLAEEVANLVNTILTDIVRVLENSKVELDLRRRAEQLLREFLPFLLRFFSDEYDEVCSTVIPSLTDLLTFLRKIGDLPPPYREMLPAILNAIVLKMRYDETSSWGNEDEQTDEAEFQELRKRLSNLQRSVAATDQSLYMDILTSLVANTFQTLGQRGSQIDWRDLDLALYEMYLFGELALPNSGFAAKSQPNSVATDRLAAMMRTMLESRIADFPHPAILLQYMEICVRYSPFFESNFSFIPQVLEDFVRLVHQEHPRIRTRSWYLFHRFVKQLRGLVGNVAGTIIQSIGDLLPIKAEVPSEDAEDDMSSDETDHSADAIFTSQLYLYEAVGCICSTPITPALQRAMYLSSVMDPLFADLQRHLESAKSCDAQAILQIHHIIMALGTLANGFVEGQPSANPGRPNQHIDIADTFARAGRIILLALGALNANAEIRTACRSAFSRLLPVLGPAVLEQLPQWIEGLLSQSSSKDEMAMFLRLLQQVVFGFKLDIYNVLERLIGPLLQRVTSGLAEPISGTDDEIQLGELKREYLSFLQTILNHELSGVLVEERNQVFFPVLIDSIVALALAIGQTTGSLAASRQAFVLMAKMASSWGGPDVATISPTPAAPVDKPAPVVQGFDSFMVDRFHPVAWEVLQNPRFQPATDAQARQVLNEIAALEQTIYTKTGAKFIDALRLGLFPRLSLPDGGEGFLRALMTSADKKVFGTYLLQLVNWRP